MPQLLSVNRVAGNSICRSLDDGVCHLLNRAYGLRMGKTLLAVLVVVGVLGLFGARSYNKLVNLDQAVQAQWSQVENVYQRRTDLVPNLVETVKGAAKFEKETFQAVTEARAKVGQVQLEGTENRISVERMRFVQTAQAFNSQRNKFPTNILAGMFGSKFAEKAYFKAQAGAETAPKVQF